MRNSLLCATVILVVLITTACRQASPPSPTYGGIDSSTSTPKPVSQNSPTTPPSVTPTVVPPSRAIILSMEGGRADWLDEWTNNGTMPTLATLRDSGVSGTLTSVNPPTSAVMHASLITGALPGNSGIVGDRVHRPQDGFYWYTPGFDLPLEAEPMWMSAQNAGKSAAVLFWPGVNPELLDQLPQYVFGYGERIAYSQVHELNFVIGSRWAGSPVSFSPSGESRFQITGVDDSLLGTIYVLALDTTDDSTPDYDTFVFSLDDRALDASDSIITSAEKWGSLVLDSASGIGGDFLITSSGPGKITLFQSGIYRLSAAPEDFRASLTDQFAFFAPTPDYYALEHGWITADDYMQMVRRQSDWMMDVTLWVDQTIHPDLLFTVQSPMSQTANQFLLVDERQQGYSADRAAEYQAYLSESAMQLDSVLLRLLESQSSESTVLLLVGTTPVAPIHTQVNLNRLLADQALLRLGRNGFVVVPASKAIAFASGGSAHIYINLAGRESAGIVQSDQFTALQDQIVELLTDLTDPDTGEAVFAHVVHHDELAALGLDGPYAGDVFVQASDGYLLSDHRTVSSIFEPASYYGQSGYDPSLPEMQTALFILSKGLEPHIIPESGSIVDIASTLAQLLDLPMGRPDGQPIPGIFP